MKKIHDSKQSICKVLLAGFVIMSVCSTTPVQASVYVWTYKSNNEVIFIDEDDSAVISSEAQNDIAKTVLPKDIEFYALTEAYTDYKLVNGKFILNTKKISDLENEKEQQIADNVTKRELIDSAKDKLIGLGLTSDEVNALHP